MEKKGFTVFLAVLAAGLLAACVWVFVTEDREPPVISVSEKDRVYDGTNRTALLEEVTALDAKDGQVRVTIEDIADNGDGTVTVSYIAMDKSGNVRQAAGMARLQADQSVQNEQNGMIPEESQPEESQANAETGEVPLETVPPETLETESVNLEAPVLTLTENEVTIGSDETFRYMNYVEEITDDKDDRDTLFRRIKAEGAESSYGPGEYEIEYYVTDTDGNRSNVEILKLTVE